MALNTSLILYVYFYYFYQNISFYLQPNDLYTCQYVSSMYYFFILNRWRRNFINDIIWKEIFCKEFDEKKRCKDIRFLLI